jgi:two-component system, LytTR family, response regulator
MLNAIVIDDDQTSRQLINEIVKHYCKEIKITAEADTLLTGIKAIKNHPPDLVFLDVELPDGTGFDLFNLMYDTSFKVIFITAHKEYAYNAIKFSPADYIIKPISPYDVINAVQKINHFNLKSDPYIPEKVINQKMMPPEKIIIKTVESIFVVLKSQIIRCESFKNYTTIILKDENNILASQTLKTFEILLPYPDFLRIHQSHLINTNYIKRIDKSGACIIMSDNSKIPIACRKREMLMNYIESLTY